MKSKLKIIRIPHGTDEWYEFRKNGIGGSEMGTVAGLNKYDTAARLYYEKIGSIEPRRDENESMFWGTELEQQIANKWQYYDGTDNGYIENYRNNKIIRTCRSVNGYVTNPDYPWLFASVDRLIDKKNGFNLITGEPLQQEAILECKNMGLMMAQAWADGLPIYHLAQVHVYFIVLELDYAEIAILVDGRKLRVEKIERDEKLCDTIIRISKSFWYDRVVPAKEAYENRQIAEINGNFKAIEDAETIIQMREPDPDHTEAYKEFMEERFAKERETTKGTMELWALAKRYNFINALVARANKDKDTIKNIFRKYMVSSGSEAIDFESSGYVSWAQRKNQKNRTLTNNVKEKPSEEYVEEEYKKLDYRF